MADLKEMFRLHNHVAVVIGGAGYLGTAMCEALVEYGASVVIASRDIQKCSTLAKKLEREYAVSCLGLKIDIMNSDEFESLFKAVYERFGRIDILINCANYTKGSSVESTTYEMWIESMQGTINAVFLAVKGVLPYMQKHHYGRIINIASMYGIVAPDPNIYATMSEQNQPPAYGTGKAGIIQFTKYIAAYYAKDGITSNAICPGSFPHKTVQKNTKFNKKLADRAMLGRIGIPDELKGATLLLASDASSYITGQSINVDGGLTSW